MDYVRTNVQSSFSANNNHWEWVRPELAREKEKRRKHLTWICLYEGKDVGKCVDDNLEMGAFDWLHQKSDSFANQHALFLSMTWLFSRRSSLRPCWQVINLFPVFRFCLFARIETYVKSWNTICQSDVPLDGGICKGKKVHRNIWDLKYRGKKAIKKLLIANNGIAAVKAIRSIRKWAYETFENDRIITIVAMATPEDLAANAEYHLCRQHSCLDTFEWPINTLKCPEARTTTITPMSPASSRSPKQPP